MWRIQVQQADCWRPIRASQTQPATSRRFACGNNGLFLSAALPIWVFPPLFNRYEIGMDVGSHVDNAIRTHVASGQHIRTDISVTLFLSAPEEYDGGGRCDPVSGSMVAVGRQFGV